MLTLMNIILLAGFAFQNCAGKDNTAFICSNDLLNANAINFVDNVYFPLFCDTEVSACSIFMFCLVEALGDKPSNAFCLYILELCHSSFRAVIKLTKRNMNRVEHFVSLPYVLLH